MLARQETLLASGGEKLKTPLEAGQKVSAARLRQAVGAIILVQPKIFDSMKDSWVPVGEPLKGIVTTPPSTGEGDDPTRFNFMPDVPLGPAGYKTTHPHFIGDETYILTEGDLTWLCVHDYTVAKLPPTSLPYDSSSPSIA